MRTIKIYRPKMMEACACKLIVEMDGKVIGKLANGMDISTEVDEQKHELYLHGGMFAGKDFSCKLSIPAGRYDYTLQTDMLSLTNGYKPMLRPCGTAPMGSAPRLRLLLGEEQKLSVPLIPGEHTVQAEGCTIRLTITREGGTEDITRELPLPH